MNFRKRHFNFVLYIVITAACAIISSDGYSYNQIMKGDVTTLYTPGVYDYKSFWLEGYLKDYIVFSVRACSDVYIALTQERGEQKFNTTEVIIGGWYNSKSVFRNGVDDQRHYLDVETPHILSCGELRTFWISWSLDELRLGKGPVPAEQTVMQLDRSWSIAHSVRFIGFCTGSGNSGVWKLTENQAQYLVVMTPTTPDDIRYNYVWQSTEYKNNHFRFWVQACHDVHVNLSPEFGAVFYQVVVGGWNNTMSVIRYGGSDRVEYRENGIVDCKEVREFWIGWDKGHIRVGKGNDINRNIFMFWADENFVGVSYVAMSAGYGSDAVWIINDDLENIYKHFSQSTSLDSESFTMFLTISYQEHIFFEIQGCSDAYVALLPDQNFSDEFLEFVYIGVDNNTRTGAKYGKFSENPLVEVKKNGLLQCNRPSMFWLSWYNGVRVFGEGNIVGFFPIMSWNLSFPTNIGVIGFANLHEFGGFVMIRKNIGDSMIVTTRDSRDDGRMWMSVRQETMVVFRVLACESVHVSLSGIMSNREIQTYDVSLGICYDAIIRDREADSSIHLARAHTKDILSCTSHRTFWISWLDRYIRVGTGYVYRQGTLLQLENPAPHPINAIGISTGNDTSGLWEFESDTGDFLVVRTPFGNLNHIKWFHLHNFMQYLRWFYFSVLGSGVHLILAPRYQDSAGAYHIHIGAEQNTMCSLWKGKTLLTQSYKAGFLADHFRHFWVSWNDGRIQLGEGRQRNLYILLDYQDTSPYTVTAFALDAQPQASGEWRIATNIVTELTMWTPVYQSFDVWWSVRHRSSAVFALKFCNHTEIMLNTLMFNQFEPDYIYTIVMRDNRNMSSIWRGSYGSSQKLIERPAPSEIMDNCHIERHYWISWLDGNLALGHGREKGMQTIVSYQDLNPSDVNAITFTTSLGVGSWRIPLSTEEFVDVPPPQLDTTTALTGGQIAGVVIGGIILVAVFFIAVFMVLYGPNRVKEIVTRFIPGNRADSANPERSTNFENPIVIDQLPEEIPL